MTKFGKYEIIEKIGEGGFGKIYKGRDPHLKRFVAIKTCRSELSDLRKRFLREAEIAANLQHPNIVTVYDFGYEERTPYFVQEYLGGEDLNHKIRRGESLSVKRKLGYLLQTARALEYAHSQGVIHRDVKPANVRVLEDDRIKIMDFGIAKLLTAEYQLTETGMTIGTAGYLPPEQIRGEEVDLRADLFAFGVLTYELLAYERPFRGKDISTVFYRIVHEEPTPLNELWKECPPKLGELVERCLKKDPAERYPGCLEIISDLEIVSIELRPTSAKLEEGVSVADAPDEWRQAPTVPMEEADTLPLSPGEGEETHPAAAGAQATEPSVRPGGGTMVPGAVKAEPVVERTVPLDRATKAGTRAPSGQQNFISRAFEVVTVTPGRLAAVVAVLVLLIGGLSVWRWTARDLGVGPGPMTPTSPTVAQVPGRGAQAGEVETAVPEGAVPLAPPPTRPTAEPRHETQAPPAGAVPSPEAAEEATQTVVATPPPDSAVPSGDRDVVPLEGPSAVPAPVEPAPAATSTDVQAGVRMPRFLVLISSDADPPDPGAKTAETRFLGELLDNGFRVVDANQIERIRRNETEMAAVTGSDPRRIAAIGQQYGAEIVVVGRLQSEAEPSVGKFHTGRAVLETRLYASATGEYLGAKTAQVGGGGRQGELGPSPLMARNAAAEAVGNLAAAEAIQVARSRLGAGQEVVLVVLGASAEEAQELRRLVGSQPGVRAVYQRSFVAGDRLELGLDYDGDLLTLGDLLDGKRVGSKRIALDQSESWRLTLKLGG